MGLFIITLRTHCQMTDEPTQQHGTEQPRVAKAPGGKHQHQRGLRAVTDPLNTPLYKVFAVIEGWVIALLSLASVGPCDGLTGGKPWMRVFDDCHRVTLSEDRQRHTLNTVGPDELAPIPPA
ncbi:hypothetical protein D3C85_1433820 [compost metagenome]